MIAESNKAPTPLEILKIRDFRNFIIGRFFLTLAIQMQMTTIGLQIYYEHTKNEFVLGLTGLFEAIPFILTSFYSGYASDHFDRRKIIIYGCTGLFFGSILLLLNCFSSQFNLTGLSYYPLFGVIIIFGIIRSFLAASMAPFMSQLVNRKLYTLTATWNSTVWHIGAILGPILGALIYGYNNGMNAKSAYVINAMLFLFGVVAFIIIPKKEQIKPDEQERVWDSLKTGLKFVFEKKNLLSALSLDLFAVLFGGAVAILPAFNDKILNAGPEALGFLRTAPAIGAVLMAVLLALWPPGKHAGKLLLGSVAAFGLFTIGFGLSKQFWMAFLMLLLTGAFDNISVVIRHSVLQLMTPEHMRGRVSAVNSIFIGSSNEIGGFESGLTARLFGLVPAIVFGGCATLAVVGSIMKFNPKLKELNLNTIDEER